MTGRSGPGDLSATTCCAGLRRAPRVIVDRHPVAERPDDEEVERDLVEAKALLDELT